MLGRCRSLLERRHFFCSSGSRYNFLLGLWGFLFGFRRFFLFERRSVQFFAGLMVLTFWFRVRLAQFLGWVLPSGSPVRLSHFFVYVAVTGEMHY